MPSEIPVAGTITGTVANGWEGVRAAFMENLADHGETGAGVAIYHRGRCVVDLTGGWFDKEQSAFYDDSTLQVVFSTTKGIMAIALAMLVDRGLLDYAAPVAHYWPEFASHGKGEATVAQLISHQCGLHTVDHTVTLDEALDWEWITSALAATAPSWPIGTGHGYHALTYGWLAGEVLRRIDGRTVGQFVREEIAGPLGVEMYIGLPTEHAPRVSPLTTVAKPVDNSGLANLGTMQRELLQRCADGLDTAGLLDGLVDELGIARNVFADRLQTLVEDSYLSKSRVAEQPNRYRYDLTPKGKEVVDAMKAEQDAAAMAEMMAQIMGPETRGGRALSLNGAFGEGAFNLSKVHAAEIPAANGISNAASLARIYAATLGEIDGVRLVSDETRERARATVTPSGEGDMCLVVPTTFGMGFMTSGMFVPYSGPGSYGHPGAGGSVAFAHPEREMSFAYVMNAMAANLAGDLRAQRLIDAAVRCADAV